MVARPSTRIMAVFGPISSTFGNGAACRRHSSIASESFRCHPRGCKTWKSSDSHCRPVIFLLSQSRHLRQLSERKFRRDQTECSPAPRGLQVGSPEAPSYGNHTAGVRPAIHRYAIRTKNLRLPRLNRTYRNNNGPNVVRPVGVDLPHRFAVETGRSQKKSIGGRHIEFQAAASRLPGTRSCPVQRASPRLPSPGQECNRLPAPPNPSFATPARSGVQLGPGNEGIRETTLSAQAGSPKAPTAEYVRGVRRRQALVCRNIDPSVGSASEPAQGNNSQPSPATEPRIRLHHQASGENSVSGLSAALCIAAGSLHADRLVDVPTSQDCSNDVPFLKAHESAASNPTQPRWRARSTGRARRRPNLPACVLQFHVGIIGS